MSFIVYPTEHYNTWISEDNADTYFEYRLHADSWDACTVKESALITAFLALQELDLNIEFESDDTISEAYYTASERAKILLDLQQAQCEQAIFEIENDPSAPAIDLLNISGLQAKMSEKPPRFSPKAYAILRPYIRASVVQRTR